jgi:8-oxo-dGTP pyrophosphatase MutT (NUDIX family)
MLPSDFTATGEAKPQRAVKPRDAATLLLWRRRGADFEILMGMRNAKLRFMPNRLVFPGGRVDPADRDGRVAAPLPAATLAALERRATARQAHAIGVAAARELNEETGLHLGPAGSALPDLSAVDYLCRAVTPPISPVRFNARFLMAPAEAASGELAGSGELERLDWYGAAAALELDLAPITGKVLQEFLALMAMSPAQRAERPLIWFQGRDRRRTEA